MMLLVVTECYKVLRGVIQCYMLLQGVRMLQGVRRPGYTN